MIVEEDSEIITAIETTPANKDDGSQLKPLLEQQEKESYLSTRNRSAAIRVMIAEPTWNIWKKSILPAISVSSRSTNPSGQDLFNRDDFIYDPVNNTLTCPAGCSS